MKTYPKYSKSILSESITRSHVHYYVEGYGADWALPIAETEFKDWVKIDNLEDELQGILDKFNAEINLTTPIVYDQKLPL